MEEQFNMIDIVLESLEKQIIYPGNYFECK
jgi:hypothetical protein